MPHKKTKVFVSYSRHDEALVKPLAGLLGVASDDAVFLDVSSLKPGDLWEEKIIGAVKEASVFVLCWCCQSQASPFVAKEIGTALSEGKKRLVPVLFCSTRLPDNLADRQWIDLRGRIVHVCNHPVEPTAPPAPAPAYAPAQEAPPPSPIASIPKAPAQVPRDPSNKPLYRMRPRPSEEPKPAAPVSIVAKSIVVISLVCLLTVVGLLIGFQAKSGATASPHPGSSTALLFAIISIAIALVAVILWSLFFLRRKATVLKAGKVKEKPAEDVIADRARSYFEGLGG